MNKDFAVTYSWIHNVLRSVVPLCVMCSLNCCIVFALRQSSHRLAVSRRPEVERRRTVMSPRNRRVTLMLVAVIGLFTANMRLHTSMSTLIGLFIVCVTPDAIMSTVFGLGYQDEGYLVRSIREITDFLLTVNSALNFVVYCAFNTVFRNRFRALITTGCRHGWQRELPRRRSGLAATGVGGLANQRVSQNHFPRAARCSLVMSTTNRQSLVIICSNSSDNIFELISVNHEGLVLGHRTVSTSSKPTGTSQSPPCNDTDSDDQ